MSRIVARGAEIQAAINIVHSWHTTQFPTVGNMMIRMAHLSVINDMTQNKIRDRLPRYLPKPTTFKACIIGHNSAIMN